MKKRLVMVILLLCLCLEQIPSEILQASGGITQQKFVTMLMTGMGLSSVNDSTQKIIEEACEKKVVKTTEKGSLLAKLTKERAAVLLQRTDSIVNGDTYDEKLYQAVLDNKRISDLNKLKKSSRASVIKVYCKGIMAGYSNGYYVQSRKFKGDNVVSLSEAKTFIERLRYPKKRKKLSPDGQLTRTDNLPANKGKYEYILATYPNSFYERKFEYQKTKFGTTPKALRDYASPAQIKKMEFFNGVTMGSVMDMNLSKWCKKVEKNIKLRFNVNYKTINNDWISKLRSTYYMFEDDAQANKRVTDDIKEYVKMVKKNKVVVKSSRVTVEPSTLYNCGDDYVRVYVRFKVVGGDVNNMNKTLYCERALIPKLKLNSWKECYFDIGIGSSQGRTLGQDYAVINNLLVDIK